MADDRAWIDRFLLALSQAAPQPPALPGMGRSTPLPAPNVIRFSPTLAPAATVAVTLTPGFLHRLGAHDADLWAPCLARACGAHGIDTPQRLAAFLANILVETGNLSSIVESLNYQPQALLAQWPRRFTAKSAQRLGRTASHPADQRNIAEAAYGGRMGNGEPGSGDGWLYRGRGLIQLTGKSSYERFAKSIGMPLADLPAHLETRQGAADSAASYWTMNGCNGPADSRDLTRCRKIVNGGEIGLPAALQNYAAACTALGLH